MGRFGHDFIRRIVNTLAIYILTQTKAELFIFTAIHETTCPSIFFID